MPIEPETEREAARARVWRLLFMERATILEDLAGAARKRAAELVAEYAFQVIIGKNGDAIVMDAPPRSQTVAAEPILGFVSRVSV